MAQSGSSPVPVSGSSRFARSRTLLDSGTVVVCTGGGIPTMYLPEEQELEGRGTSPPSPRGRRGRHRQGPFFRGSCSKTTKPISS